MKHESMRTVVMGTLSALLLATLLATSGAAQTPPKETVAKPPAKPAVTKTPDTKEQDSKAAASKKLRGRLPAYYGKVVSTKQREEIYQIQAKFNEQIEKLKEQLATLTTQRDSEVEQVLTDEQQDEIAKLKQSRRAQRSSSSETNEPPNQQ